MEPLVHFVVLNYRGYIDTIECIESILKISYSNFRIVVVDNDSQDESVEKLREKYPHLNIVQAGENKGYAGGNNVGIEYSLKNGAKYICIINNDVVVEKDFLNYIVDYMEENENVALAGPRIGDYYNKNIIHDTGAVINYYKGTAKYINYQIEKKELQSINIECDYVGGACIVVPSTLISIIGKIPENYFLFFEETEWCTRAKKMGYKVICCSKAVIWHKESATTNRNSKMKQYYLERNRVLFEKRNANRLQYFIFIIYISQLPEQSNAQ